MIELMPDYSHWQYPTNLSVLPEKGITRVLIKATDGYILDKNYPDIAKQAVITGLRVELYHWWKPAFDPIKQANNLVTAGRLVPGLNIIGYTVDVEEVPNFSGNHAGNLLKFLLEVERQTGYRPVIYTRSSFWKLYYQAAYTWASFYPLHVAHYKDFSGPSVCSPWSPLGYSKWQFTDRENGPIYGAASKQVDMSEVIPETIYKPPTITLLEIQEHSLLASFVEIPKYTFTVRELWIEFLAQRKRNPRKD